MNKNRLDKKWFVSLTYHFHVNQDLINPLTPVSVLTDFTLSNTRRFYLSTRDILGCLGSQWVKFKFKQIEKLVTLSETDHCSYEQLST